MEKVHAELRTDLTLEGIAEDPAGSGREVAVPQ
jgi:hypothetical protein